MFFSANALQSVFLLDTAEDIFDRFATIDNDSKPQLSGWNLNAAREIIKLWKREFSKEVRAWNEMDTFGAYDKKSILRAYPDC